MRHFSDSFRGLLAALLCACLLTGFFALPAANSEEYWDPDTETVIQYGQDDTQDSEDPSEEKPAETKESTAAAEEKQVLIYLQEALPENRPYTTSGTKYQRDAAVPILSGARGFVYKKTTQVYHWLFPVSYAQGTPTLYLSLEGIKDPVSVSINNELLSVDKPVAVPLKEMAELRVANTRVRSLIRLMFTSLPIVQFSTDVNIYKGVDSPCTITVSDPDYRAHGLTEPVTTYDGVVSRRGKSSSRYAAKHPYNISLMKDGQKLDQSLLGMRNDSDWLLDSAYNDRSRMRNRVLMDIWHDLYRLPWDQSLSGATKGVYVELFVGTAYRGLYVLGEKQDRRQLGLSKRGGKWNSSFFRTGDAGKDGASPAGFVSMGREKPIDDDPLRWYNVWLRFPQGKDINYKAEWSDFYDYVRLVVKGSPEEFAAKITQYADLDNLARYWLFTNAADITDNMRKNMSFARLDDRDPRFNRYILVPWDMDSSLGRYYSSKKSRVEELVTNRLFNRLINENPNGFRETLYTLWQALKKDTLSVDSIMAHFEHYYDIICASGADKREMDKHPTFKSYVKAGYSFDLDFAAELKYIRTYTEKHINWLDGKIEEIRENGLVSAK